MRISFFEEYPSKKNLEKLVLVNFPTNLFIGVPSLSKFQDVENVVGKNKNVREVVYWPLLKKEEGYWISPWAKRDALKRVFGEVDGKKVTLMIDAEPFYRRNFFLQFVGVIKDLFTFRDEFFKNRKLIRDFVRRNKCYTAEFYPSGLFFNRILEFYGLSFNSKEYKNKIIKMRYGPSERSISALRETCNYWINRDKKRFLVGLGVIAKGEGIEERLTPEQLDYQLNLANLWGVNEVVIYRLGGLNNAYIDVIKKYV